MSEWISEHGLLFVVIAVSYLIIRDLFRALLKKEPNGNGYTLLSQKADHAINIAQHNSERIDKLLDKMAEIARQLGDRS